MQHQVLLSVVTVNTRNYMNRCTSISIEVIISKQKLYIAHFGCCTKFFVAKHVHMHITSNYYLHPHTFPSEGIIIAAWKL